MHLRMRMRPVVYCVAISIGCLPQAVSAQRPGNQFELKLISGTDKTSIAGAEASIKLAKSLEDCKDVTWAKSSKVDRLIGIFDGNLAGRPNGETTILPFVDKFPIQQSVAFYKKKKSKLTDDELIQICNCLPWNSDDLPKGIEFHRSFEDPLNLSSFASVIVEKRSLLGFAAALEEKVGPVRYIASSTLKSKKDGQTDSLMVVGLNDHLDLANIKLGFPDSPEPLKKLVHHSMLVLLFSADRDSKATVFFKKWLENL